MKTTTSLLRILIADDHEVMRDGTRALIERQPGWEVCGIAGTGREAVAQALLLQPDIVIMDMTMPDLNGLDAAVQIKRRLPRTEILIFTAHETEELIRQVFEAGAKSFIFKSEAHHFLVEAIQSLSQHKPFFTNKVSQVLFADILNRSETRPHATETSNRLTMREREIVQLLSEGQSNKEVAAVLGIRIRTAETHRASVLRKLSLDSLASLVRYAIRNKIIEGDRLQLHRVLTNLLLNAREAMPQGGLLVASARNFNVDQRYASMTLGATLGQYVMLRVSDTGRGTPRSVIDNIFTPFLERKEIGPGTSLGLIKGHGGFMSVYSRFGKGTTFQIFLPAKAVEEPVRKHKKTSAANGRVSAGRRNHPQDLELSDQ